MKGKVVIALATAMVLSAASAFADEGMWMVHAITKALEADMQAKGCKLSAGEIYNCDAPGSALCDAIVSLDFGCTGSMISDNGLLITNHHCAFSDIHEISTEEHNYLEDGYWAVLMNQEVPIAGKRAYFLHKVIDVTDEVNTLIDGLKKVNQPYGMRRVSSIMEKRYAEGRLEASLESMWAGSKYYICLYEVYEDIRLVAAPPVSIAAFGGDIDNWEWPQHKCDFAMYRIYTAPDGSPAAYDERNVPLKSRRKLEISTRGYKDGDFTMVLGYPGITHRYNSSAKVEYEQNVSLPISDRIRGGIMSIMKSAMESDPSVSLKYSEKFFSLSNVQENEEGTMQCYKRFNVVGEKQDIERELAEWIAADEGRTKRWGELLKDLDSNYAAVRELKHDENLFRECLVRGCSMFLVSTRLTSSRNKPYWNSIDKLYSTIDLALERQIFRFCIEEYFKGVSPQHLGAYQKELLSKYGEDWDAMCSALWEGSYLTDMQRLDSLKADISLCDKDPMMLFYNDVKALEYHKEEDEVCYKDILSVGREYTRALYAMRLDKGISQYPDANSTMRLTYGRVGSLYPKDAVMLGWQTSVSGILEKYDPLSYDFNLKSDWLAMIRKKPACERFNWHGEVDFLTDNDITGGNSGSPVIDAEGRLIGLAFDGNKESLAGDSSYTGDYNKCINVDIRYVLYTLSEYAGMERIISELCIKN